MTEGRPGKGGSGGYLASASGSAHQGADSPGGGGGTQDGGEGVPAHTSFNGMRLIACTSPPSQTSQADLSPFPPQRNLLSKGQWAGSQGSLVLWLEVTAARLSLRSDRSY